MPDRSGKRKTREQIARRRAPQLGHYLVVTDAKATEKNYLQGLKQALPVELREKLVLQVSTVKTIELVDEAIKKASLLPQYAELWMVFDRDQVPSFNEIIATAGLEGIQVGWSNPCIELWFSAYFGELLTSMDSVTCCNKFSALFKQKTGQEYKKSDSNIYLKLRRSGDEARAIRRARRKLAQYQRDGITVPSDMHACTTLHELVDKIRTKVEISQENKPTSRQQA
ncbi:MAG: RloB family protein [Christensenellales bacterium]|jgi:hypothetical protein